MIGWIAEHLLELFGAVTGIIYVILEIRRNILLWPLGIITSAVYIWVFSQKGFYAGMVLQGYYVVISIYGWYKWHRPKAPDVPSLAAVTTDQADPPAGGSVSGAEGSVKSLDRRTALFCLLAALALWGLLWYSLDRWTDSPVPLWDGLITSLSVVATWMLTRKYLEQWYVWILANAIAVIVYLAMDMHPTAVLFFVYFVMAIIGIISWSKDRPSDF